jgi:hypothetical protein
MDFKEKEKRKSVTCAFHVPTRGSDLACAVSEHHDHRDDRKEHKDKGKKKKSSKSDRHPTTTTTAATIARAVTVTSLATTVEATAIAPAVLPASPLLTTRVCRWLRRPLRLRLRLRRRRCRLRQFRLKRFSRGNSSDFRHHNSSSSKLDLRFSSRSLVAAQ